MLIAIDTRRGHRKLGVSVRIRYQWPGFKNGNTRITVRIGSDVLPLIGWNVGSRLSIRYGFGRDFGIAEVSESKNGNVLRLNGPASSSAEVMFLAPWLPRSGHAHSTDLVEGKTWRRTPDGIIFSLPSWALPSREEIDSHAGTRASTG